MFLLIWGQVVFLTVSFGDFGAFSPVLLSVTVQNDCQKERRLRNNL